QIMDLADEIAYGAHDLEDALSINLFSIDEFLFNLSNVSTSLSLLNSNKNSSILNKFILHASSKSCALYAISSAKSIICASIVRTFILFSLQIFLTMS